MKAFFPVLAVVAAPFVAAHCKSRFVPGSRLILSPQYIDTFPDFITGSKLMVLTLAHERLTLTIFLFKILS